MTASPIHRAAAVLAAAALIATLAVTALAAEVEAAKPKPRCQGKVATIVGSAKSERIIGTAGRDVIVARGGNDRIYGRGGNDVICAGGGNDIVYGGPEADTIWGQLGHDKLYGNSGPDFLAGQVGNDRLNGGIGVDTCFQGTGTGPLVRCERPAPPAPLPPAPAPTPTPEPPILIVAYSDLDGSGTFSAGDVMISKLVDTNGDTVPSKGDTIKMGQYPVAPNPTSSDQFLSWGKPDHIVENVERSDGHVVIVRTPTGGSHQWVREFQSQVHDMYVDSIDVGPVEHTSVIVDHYGTNPDLAHYDALCPSQPAGTFDVVSPGIGDDPLIEVDFLWGVSIL